MDPLVSFVVPCYKLAHLLPQCVNSILRQNYENFEVLIMDNCSPDQTPEVAQSFNDPRVKHIRNESNLGHIRNFNKGVTLARGKYVWLIMVDDVLRSPHVLRRYVDLMERNTNVGFVFCRAVELHGEKEGGIYRWGDCGDQDCVWHDPTFIRRLLESNCIAASSVFVRKECYEKVGLFQPDLPFASDWYMWIMLAMHYGVAYLAEPMIFIRFHQGSLTVQYSRDYARMCAGDELSVLWRVAHEAELAQEPSLRDACHAAFVRRANGLLMAGLWGIGNRISATEFDEILKSRVRDLTAMQQVRVSVYTSLTEDVKTLYHAHDVPIGPADEISFYWDLCCQAKLAGVPSLCDTCKLVLAHRLSFRLQARAFNTTPELSGAEFAEILHSRIPDVEAAKDLRALVYRDLGDQQYTRREYGEATQSYRLALEARPDHSGTSAKYLLMRIGVPGIWIRQLAGQVRESSQRVRHASQQSPEPAKTEIVGRHPCL